MADNLENKVLVITGAGGGIGSAISEKLAQEKLKIVLLGGNNIWNLEKTRSAVEKYTSCLAIPGDLTDLNFLDDALKKAADTFGSIDILINNAGMTHNTPIEDISEEQFDKIMTINCKVPFFLTQKALPYLKKSTAPTIVNIASVVAHSGYPMQSVYSASKHAMLGFTKSLAAEYYKDNIRVHAISPGGVFTDMVRISRPDLTSDGMILSEDIAEIVHFLLTHRTNAVIDEILVHRAGKEPFLV